MAKTEQTTAHKIRKYSANTPLPTSALEEKITDLLREFYTDLVTGNFAKATAIIDSYNQVIGGSGLPEARKMLVNVKFATNSQSNTNPTAFRRAVPNVSFFSESSHLISESTCANSESCNGLQTSIYEDRNEWDRRVMLRFMETYGVSFKPTDKREIGLNKFVYIDSDSSSVYQMRSKHPTVSTPVAADGRSVPSTQGYSIEKTFTNKSDTAYYSFDEYHLVGPQKYSAKINVYKSDFKYRDKAGKVDDGIIVVVPKEKKAEHAPQLSVSTW